MRWSVGDKTTLEHKFTKSDVDAFIALTGDDNPIHVDETYASKTEVGGCVVHGMLVASFISTVVGKKIPGDGALWLSFNVNWKNPVRIDADIIFEAVVLGVKKSTLTTDLAITAKDKTSGTVYLEANATAMDMYKKKL